ncbi:hypothetical protein FQA39_LY06355 [Lamprigera yunnana]|nr:hypothetical protein FQA39_LY06355 [Lamprigera yunnana]
MKQCAYDSLGESSQAQTQIVTNIKLHFIFRKKTCDYTFDSETGLFIPNSIEHSENGIEEPSLLSTPKVNNKNTRKRKRNNIEDNSQFFMESTKALQNLTIAMESKHTNNLPDTKNQILANYIVSKLGEIHEDFKVDVEMGLSCILVLYISDR